MDLMSRKEDNSSSMSLIEKAAARLDRLEEQENARTAARRASSADGAAASTIERAAATRPNAVPAPVAPIASVAPSAPAQPRSRAAAPSISARSNGLSARAQQARIKATANIRRGSAPVAQAASIPEVAPPPMHELRFAMLESEGFLVPGEGSNQLAQEFRRIKRPLLLNMRKDAVAGSSSKPANLLMISSALPNEGKTFVSVNMAMSMAAEMNRKVLLVDADVAKGHVGRTLGYNPEYGLSDILKNPDLSEDGAIAETNVDGLSLLGSGANDMHMDELFASQRMTDLTRRLALADPDRVVVVDAPPILATTEAGVLARLMGQIVLVVLFRVVLVEPTVMAMATGTDTGMVTGMALKRLRVKQLV